MTSTATPVNNGVNVEALLGAREALTEAPDAAKFEWRASCEWQNGTHSSSTVEGFFGLVFVKVRQVLLDMAQGQRRVDARLRPGPRDTADSEALASLDQADTTHDPGRLAMLTEFHEQVGKLPDEQRIVFARAVINADPEIRAHQITRSPPRHTCRTTGNSSCSRSNSFSRVSSLVGLFRRRCRARRGPAPRRRQAPRACHPPIRGRAAPGRNWSTR